MTTRGKPRLSGEPGAVEEARKAADEMLVADDPMPPQEERFRTPKFHRMSFSLDPASQMVMQRARSTVQQQIISLFSDAYWILNQVWDIVREPERHPDGSPVLDANNMTVWKQKETGLYDEDFTRLSRSQKEHFMNLVTTRLFAWEQLAADLWGEAMLARARFEERFAISYDAPVSGTVEDRKAAGNRDAAEERYYAIYASMLSRRADAIVRSMDRIALRLRDSMQ